MTLTSRLRTVLLALVLLPLLAVATAPRAVSALPTDHYLKLVSLQCIDTEDWAADEPYLIVNGMWVWGSDSLNNGQTADLTSVPAKALYDRSEAEVELYDYDTPDGDDWLGTNSIPVTQAGLGYRTVSFTRNGANYKLTYYIY